MLPELLAEIRRQGDDGAGTGPEPVVGLELFFEGNDDLGSIGGNLPRHPGIPTFYEVLKGVRDRPDVHDVRVGIGEVADTGEWPFGSHVYVVTSAPPGEVCGWVAELQPQDDPGSTWYHGTPPLDAPVVPSGMHLVTLWWD